MASWSSSIILIVNVFLLLFLMVNEVATSVLGSEDNKTKKVF